MTLWISGENDHMAYLDIFMVKPLFNHKKPPSKKVVMVK